MWLTSTNLQVRRTRRHIRFISILELRGTNCYSVGAIVSEKSMVGGRSFESWDVPDYV
jgi:hypothetical protein